MRYSHYLPKAPLNEHIELFWQFADWDLPHHRERVLPAGTMELVIDLSPINPTLPAPLLSGVYSQPSTIGIAPQTSLLGVHFKAGGTFPFLPAPASELHNQRVTLDEFWGMEAAQLREQLLAQTSVKARFATLERFLLLKLEQERQLHAAVAFAVRQFQRTDQLPSVTVVAEQTGYSHRHFLQLFRAQVGLPPKLFCRIQRFQQTLTFLHTRHTIEWAEAAATLGYFDQAHLINEFQAFAGLSPTIWLAQRGENPHHLPLAD